MQKPKKGSSVNQNLSLTVIFSYHQHDRAQVLRKTLEKCNNNLTEQSLIINFSGSIDLK